MVLCQRPCHDIGLVGDAHWGRSVHWCLDLANERTSPGDDTVHDRVLRSRLRTPMLLVYEVDTWGAKSIENQEGWEEQAYMTVHILQTDDLRLSLAC